jgi:SAM-dependent methyltransferase
MELRVFDQYAEAYDRWFMENRVVLASELLLLKRAVGQPGVALSVGCGSGLFEYLLRTEHGIVVQHGVEPSPPMAEIARKRGMSVVIGVGEALPHADESFDTVILNGSSGYMKDLAAGYGEAFRVLRPGGHIVVLDVPAESSYGLLYRLAATIGTWDDVWLKGVAPACPYPVELARSFIPRPTPERASLLCKVGFVELGHYQTLTRHPRYSNDRVEEPIEGYDCGDYVAIRAHKPVRQPHVR